MEPRAPKYHFLEDSRLCFYKNLSQETINVKIWKKYQNYKLYMLRKTNKTLTYQHNLQQLILIFEITLNSDKESKLKFSVVRK